MFYLNTSINLLISEITYYNCYDRTLLRGSICVGLRRIKFNYLVIPCLPRSFRNAV